MELIELVALIRKASHEYRPVGERPIGCDTRGLAAAKHVANALITAGVGDDAKTYTRTVIVRDGADMGIHTVVCVNAHYYVCDRCGIAGSERWAILHQFPPDDATADPT